MRRTKTHAAVNSAGEAIAAVPDSVLQSIGQQAAEAGGEWQQPAEHEGCVGWTMFDTPASDDDSITVLLPSENIEKLPGQSLVRIKSISDGRTYLGAVVKGPFTEPDGLRADANIVVTATVRGRGGIFFPKYHGRTQIALIGEELDDGGIVPPRRRPLPNSPVFVLSSEETAKVSQTGGDIRLGVAEGHEDIEVRVPLKKSVFPRHIGILGTTGGGKSTTVSNLIAQLQNAGVVSVVIDTEGEYAAICDETDSKDMQLALVRRGLPAGGVNNSHIYHLVGRETRNPKHTSKFPFSLLFCELSPYTVMEILDLSDAQQERFLKAYDITKLVLERLKIYPKNNEEREEQFYLDELESGYPRMTLTHIYDIVKMIAARVAKEPQEPFLEAREFNENRSVLNQAIDQSPHPGVISSWRAVQGKLGRVKRLRIFDNPQASPLDYDEMLQPGRVSIVDLSDSDSPQVNNMVIAQILRGIQRQQEEHYRKATASGAPPKPTMVFIEEAHEFLSAQRIKKMEVLFQQVARIARRGRKRWLGLVFITQLPQHLPDEVLGLINNWILHKISDSNVVRRLRHSIGGIDEPLWGRLPGLAAGQAIVSFTSLARPLLAAIDPTPCRLLLVE